MNQMEKFYLGDFKLLKDALSLADKTLLKELHECSRVRYDKITDQPHPKHLIYFLKGASHWCHLYEDYKHLSGNEALIQFYKAYCENDWSLTEHRMRTIKDIMTDKLSADNYLREMEIMDEFLSCWLCGTDYDHEAPELIMRVFGNQFLYEGDVYRGIELETMEDLELRSDDSFKSYTDIPKIAEHFSNNPNSMKMNYSVVISGVTKNGFALYKFILSYINITSNDNLKSLIEDFAHEREILIKDSLTDIKLKVTNNLTGHTEMRNMSVISSDPLS